MKCENVRRMQRKRKRYNSVAHMWQIFRTAKTKAKQQQIVMMFDIFIIFSVKYFNLKCIFHLLKSSFFFFFHSVCCCHFCCHRHQFYRLLRWLYFINFLSESQLIAKLESFFVLASDKCYFIEIKIQKYKWTSFFDIFLSFSRNCFSFFSNFTHCNYNYELIIINSLRLGIDIH